VEPGELTMPHTDPDLRDDPDAWLDRLLVEDAAQHRDAYVDDAGFTARVMDALPAPAALPRWRKPALTALWATAGLGLAFALPGAALDVSREAFRLLAAQPISLSAVAAALVAFGVATWTGAAWVMRRD
jgi:hypothetical protein